MQARPQALHFLAFLFILPMVVIGSFVLAAAQPQSKPHAKVVVLDKPDNGVLPILAGPPETVTMKSGYVVLEPGRSVGKHSTEQHEEILIVLEGEGEMLFHDGSKLELKARTALYCPPETEHDVWNTGSQTLRYVYVVAKAE
jgi:mannose-6-phosphate isomerase-like protein (cupin superfamily)